MGFLTMHKNVLIFKITCHHPALFHDLPCDDLIECQKMFTLLFILIHRASDVVSSCISAVT